MVMRYAVSIIELLLLLISRAYIAKDRNNEPSARPLANVGGPSGHLRFRAFEVFVAEIAILNVFTGVASRHACSSSGR